MTTSVTTTPAAAVATPAPATPAILAEGLARLVDGQVVNDVPPAEMIQRMRAIQ